MKHEIKEINTKIYHTIRAVGNQPLAALIRMAYTRAKVPEPRYYKGSKGLILPRSATRLGGSK
ncbi:hypothetical protein PanWU01x14_303230, partial [Parasponia andersonii]